MHIIARITTALLIIVATRAPAASFSPPATVLVFKNGKDLLTNEILQRLADFASETRKFIHDTTLEPSLYRGRVIICAQREVRSRRASRLADHRANLVVRELTRQGLERLTVAAPDQCGNAWAGKAAVQLLTAPS